MTDPRESPHDVLTALAARAPRLDVSTIDVCFLAALHLRANGEVLTSFGESELLAVFDDVCAALEPAADNRRRRATHAIQRLRDQRLLARVDGAGITRSGEYALTRLAHGIVDFFLSDEALTRENLTLLMRTLSSSLALVVDAARAAKTGEQWQAGVIDPLTVTVRDLVAGIERRQRGLDLQQEEFQKEISSLLETDWFGAVDRCQALLESTATTLRELNEILLRDSHELGLALQEIQELALENGARDAEGATRRVSEQLDRIAAWGASRQRAWSEYYQYVHHYLRDVVRLDPSRALTQRLREQLSGRRGPRFSLTVAQAAPMHVLREVVPVVAPPPVKRPRAKQEPLPESAAAENPEQALENGVRDALASGVSDLSQLTYRLTAELPREERFAAAGRIAEIAARLTRPLAARERPWVAGGDDLELEEWALRRTGGDT